MPEKSQEKLPRPHDKKNVAEKGILAGIGVLLFFLGLWSKSILTQIFCFGIGAFTFYIVYEMFRETRKGTKGEARSEIPMSQQKVIVFDEKGASSYEVAARPMTTVLEHREEDELHIPQPAVQSFSAQESAKEHHPPRRFASADFINDETSAPSETQGEFHNLLMRILNLVKEITFAHTVAFFWVKRESTQLVIEGKVSDSKAFISERKISLGNDIVSRIALHTEPELLNGINSGSEKDLLRYYTSLQDVKSFIGVPVFYTGGDHAAPPIAVLAVDSKADDAFGEETYSILGHCAKLISALLKSSTEKFDLAGDAKLIEAERRLREHISPQVSIPALVNTFTAELSELVQWEAMSVVLFDDTVDQWSIVSVRVRGADRFVAAKQRIDLENSVVGHCIRENSVRCIPDLSLNAGMVFHEHEKDSRLLREGTLIVVPISTIGKCYGAVTVSSDQKNMYGPKDIETVRQLASLSADALELSELNTIIAEHVAVDEQTGVFTRKYFVRRLEEEVDRATDRGEELSLVLISLTSHSDIEQRYGKNAVQTAVAVVSQLLGKSVRAYDVVGRYDESTFGVILTDTIPTDAFLWAEKIRSAVAGTVMSTEQRNFSTTVTIGVCGATEHTTANDCLTRASQILAEAKMAGGNIARVY